MGNIKVIENKDNVIFKFDYSTFEKELVFENRYFAYSVNRWDIILNDLERYCLYKGEKGCFDNASIYKEVREFEKTKHGYSRSNNIWIIDFKKVFPNVQFKENNVITDVIEIMKSPTIKWYDNTDEI